MKNKNFKIMGFYQAFIYLLDVLCYAYYTQSDNLVSDKTFDELEKLFCILFDEKTAPNRGLERECLYTKGVQVVYDILKKKREKK